VCFYKQPVIAAIRVTDDEVAIFPRCQQAMRLMADLGESIGK
jgi:hypothetical protein